MTGNRAIIQQIILWKNLKLELKFIDPTETKQKFNDLIEAS